jgi:hypothetical protein
MSATVLVDRWSPSLAADFACLPRGQPAAQQRSAVHSRPTRRGDHRRQACGRRVDEIMVSGERGECHEREGART